AQPAHDVPPAGAHTNDPVRLQAEASPDVGGQKMTKGYGGGSASSASSPAASPSTSTRRRRRADSSRTAPTSTWVSAPIGPRTSGAPAPRPGSTRPAPAAETVKACGGAFARRPG